jgi:hypothetical protein
MTSINSATNSTSHNPNKLAKPLPKIHLLNTTPNSNKKINPLKTLKKILITIMPRLIMVIKHQKMILLLKKLIRPPVLCNLIMSDLLHLTYRTLNNKIIPYNPSNTKEIHLKEKLSRKK